MSYPGGTQLFFNNINGFWQDRAGRCYAQNQFGNLQPVQAVPQQHFPQPIDLFRN